MFYWTNTAALSSNYFEDCTHSTPTTLRITRILTFTDFLSPSLVAGPGFFSAEHKTVPRGGTGRETCGLMC